MSSSKGGKFTDEELEALDAWTTLTEFGRPRPAPPPKPAAPSALTVEQIEAIQKQAYEEAFEQGKRDGFEKGRLEGIEQGKKLGYEDGSKKGYQDNLQLLRKQADELVKLLEALAEPFNNLDEEVEQELVKMVMIVARQIIRREIKMNPGEIVAVVREAVRALPVATQKITINLHPEDVQLVRTALDLEDGSSPWRIIENPLITRGGCTVETDISYVDATLEKRLAAVTAAVWGGQRDEDAAT